MEEETIRTVNQTRSFFSPAYTDFQRITMDKRIQDFPTKHSWRVYRHCNVLWNSVVINIHSRLVFRVHQGILIYLSNSCCPHMKHSTSVKRFVTLVGRTPWTGDQPDARQLPIPRTTQTQNKHRQTSMP
jgi:hypothetical protein